MLVRKEEEWVPVTRLGRLVKNRKVNTIDEIFYFSLCIKECQIVDYFLPKLEDEILKIAPVQKQTRAGQRTRFKAFIVVGDSAGHVGLGVKCSKEVATAIRGAMILAKLSIVPVRLDHWGSTISNPHTVPTKVTGKCGSVQTRLVPAPRGTGLVAAPAPKKLLQLAGIKDCYTTSRGSTRTLGNFVKAAFIAVSRTYRYLTPDMWEDMVLEPAIYERRYDYSWFCIFSHSTGLMHLFIYLAMQKMSPLLPSTDATRYPQTGFNVRTVLWPDLRKCSAPHLRTVIAKPNIFIYL